MLKALKVILIVYGALSAVTGVLHVFAPGMLMGTMGLEVGELPDIWMPVMYTMAMIGISLIAGGVYLIVAGTRDIIRHIYWVQFAILWAILAVAGAVYSVIMGYVTFNQVMMPVIIDGAFFIVLMALYPWGRTGY